MGDDGEKDQKEKKGRERRKSDRFPTFMKVNYTDGETFLYSYIENISDMGIFVYSEEPFDIGTELNLQFGREEDEDPIEIRGRVMWVNPVRNGGNINPGMGIEFLNLTADTREQIVELVKSVAYLTGKKNAELN